MRGVEFFHPGILDRVPIEAVPLPLVARSYLGPPPADLEELGLVPPGEDSDARRFPEVFLPADEWGFPNTENVERADIVLVGDSFTVAAGAIQPKGLQARLVEATGLTVYNLGVSGIGPVREAWLLENVGLKKNPRCVLWFFFSGNDAHLSAIPLVEKRKGNETWGQLKAHRRPPLLILPDVARELLVAALDRPSHDALPGFRFTLADGTVQPLWFNPCNLRVFQLVEDWETNNGWINARKTIERARETCAEAGVAFILIYLPSKAEVYLPYVEEDPDLIHRTLSFQHPEPLSDDPRTLLRELLERRGKLEASVDAFCSSAGIPFLSATPFLESLAREGELGYLVADTHWQTTGQAVLLEPLLSLLTRESVLTE